MKKSIFISIGLLIAAGVLLFIPFNIDQHGVLAGVWMDFLHLPFALVVFVSVYRLMGVLKTPVLRLFGSGALALFGLICAEFFQEAVGRSFSYHDLLYDVLGVLIGLLLMGRSEMLRSSCIWLIALLVMCALIIPLEATLDVRKMNQQWPIIADFQKPYEEPFIQLLGVKSLEGGDYEAEGSAAYPSVFIEHPRKDWAGYASLKVHLTMSHEQEVTVRIDDQTKAEGYGQRFQYEAIVPEGPYVICIPINKGLITSGGREMDLQTIHRVGVIVDGKKAGQKFSIQKLELDSAECY